jgi:dnd system-associated protein 4
MERRPALPKDLESVIESLVDPTGSGERVFDTKQKAMMFAAALGFAAGTRKKLERKSTGIRYDVFQSAVDDGFINALAVSETGDLAVLSEGRADERIDIFEEYAHAGVEVMNRLCVEEGNGLDNLIRRTLEAQESESEIPGIDPSVLRNLLG